MRKEFFFQSKNMEKNMTCPVCNRTFLRKNKSRHNRAINHKIIKYAKKTFDKLSSEIQLNKSQVTVDGKTNKET